LSFLRRLDDKLEALHYAGKMGNDSLTKVEDYLYPHYIGTSRLAHVAEMPVSNKL